MESILSLKCKVGSGKGMEIPFLRVQEVQLLLEWIMRRIIAQHKPALRAFSVILVRPFDTFASDRWTRR